MLTNDPAVTILMPAYNAAAFIGPAIESALRQTEARFELLVIDDCSTDDTASRVLEFGVRDDRVRLIRMAQNGGPAAARNRGIEEARGTWITLLDTDDFYDPSRLEKLLALGNDNGADVVSDNLLVRPDNEDAYRLIPAGLLTAPKPMSAADFVMNNVDDSDGPHVCYGFMKPMIRRDFLLRHGLGYESQARFGEDYILYSACLRAGARWWITPDPLYIYVTRAGSLTGAQTRDDLARVSKSDEDWLDDPATSPELARALRLHKAKVDRKWVYSEFMTRAKFGRVREAARLLISSKEVGAMIMLETLRRMPRLALKAVGVRGIVETPSL